MFRGKSNVSEQPIKLFLEVMWPSVVIKYLFIKKHGTEGGFVGH